VTEANVVSVAVPRDRRFPEYRDSKRHFGQVAAQSQVLDVCGSSSAADRRGDNVAAAGNVRGGGKKAASLTMNPITSLTICFMQGPGPALADRSKIQYKLNHLSIRPDRSLMRHFFGADNALDEWAEGSLAKFCCFQAGKMVARFE
jgi:hypothetical protein